MLIPALTLKEFETIIEQYPLLVLDFWASWCAPCKEFKKIYVKVAKEYPDILFAEVNIEKEPDFADLFHIHSIPHLLILKQGIAIYSESGMLPESTFKELIEQAITADVSDISSKL